MSLNIFVFDAFGVPFASEEERNPLTYLAWFRQWDSAAVFEGTYHCTDLEMETPNTSGIFIRLLDERYTCDDILVVHRNLTEQTIFKAKPVLQAINVELFSKFLPIGEWGVKSEIVSNGSSDDGYSTIMIKGLAPYLDRYIADLRREQFSLIEDKKDSE